MPLGVDEDVDPGMPLVGVVLLAELSKAGDLAVGEDRKTCRLRLIGEWEVVGERSPPCRDLGHRRNRAQRRRVFAL